MYTYGTYLLKDFHLYLYQLYLYQLFVYETSDVRCDDSDRKGTSF